MDSSQDNSQEDEVDVIMDDSDDEEYMLPLVPMEPEVVAPPRSGPRTRYMTFGTGRTPPPAVSSLVGTSSQFWNSVLPLPMYSSAGAVPRGTFSSNLKVYSIAMLPHARPELENGGKIILPPSALDRLTSTRVQLIDPMLFKATHIQSGKLTHCGVLEFIADEGKCFMPFWMMHNIGANEGDTISVESVKIPIATFALFQPQSVDFLDITNPKALLENVLRNFACITKGEIIAIHYNGRLYELKILDTKPADAVNIIECDMSVDFSEPIGYVSPTRNDEMDTEEDPLALANVPVNGFIPFEGAGSRLDGKTAETGVDDNQPKQHRRGLPDFDWEFGSLHFNRKLHRKAAGPQDQKSFAAFEGAGQSLRNNKSQESNPDQ